MALTVVTRKQNYYRALGKFAPFFIRVMDIIHATNNREGVKREKDEDGMKGKEGNREVRPLPI